MNITDWLLPWKAKAKIKELLACIDRENERNTPLVTKIHLLEEKLDTTEKSLRAALDEKHTITTTLMVTRASERDWNELAQKLDLEKNELASLNRSLCDQLEHAKEDIALWKGRVESERKHREEIEKSIGAMKNEIHEAHAMAAQAVKLQEALEHEVVEHREAKQAVNGLTKWIKTAHRLDAPSPRGTIRRILQSARFKTKAVAGLLLLASLTCFGQAPFWRNPWSTNQSPPVIGTNLWISNTASGMAWMFYNDPHSNRVARLWDITNMSPAVAGTGPYVSNYAGLATNMFSRARLYFGGDPTTPGDDPQGYYTPSFGGTRFYNIDDPGGGLETNHHHTFNRNGILLHQGQYYGDGGWLTNLTTEAFVAKNYALISNATPGKVAIFGSISDLTNSTIDAGALASTNWVNGRFVPTLNGSATNFGARYNGSQFNNLYIGTPDNKAVFQYAPVEIAATSSLLVQGKQTNENTVYLTNLTPNASTNVITVNGALSFATNSIVDNTNDYAGQWRMFNSNGVLNIVQPSGGAGLYGVQLLTNNGGSVFATRYSGPTTFSFGPSPGSYYLATSAKLYPNGSFDLGDASNGRWKSIYSSNTYTINTVSSNGMTLPYASDYPTTNDLFISTAGGSNSLFRIYNSNSVMFLETASGTTKRSVTFSSNGAFSVSGSFTAGSSISSGGSLIAAASQPITWGGGTSSALRCPTNGTLKIGDSASSTVTVSTNGSTLLFDPVFKLPWSTPSLGVLTNSAVGGTQWGLANTNGAMLWFCATNGSSITNLVENRVSQMGINQSNIWVKTQMEERQPLGCYGAMMFNTTNYGQAFGASSYTNITGFNIWNTNWFIVNTNTGYMTNVFAGYYRCIINVSMVGQNAGIYEGCMLTNDVDSDLIAFQHQHDNPARWRSATGGGIIYLPANTGCSFALKSDVPGAVQFKRGSLIIGTP